MDAKSLKFLKSLLDAPGPSSYETAPARLWRAEAEGFADQVSADVNGNSFATVNPGAAGPSVMFAGHVDEIGVMVSYIDDDGFLTFAGIGGWDPQVFVGQRVILLGRQGAVRGVIGKKAIHLMEKGDREKVSKAEDLWIDIGARNRAEAEARIRIGDPGVLASSVEEFPHGRLISRSIDNRIGAFVVLQALRQLAADRPRVPVTAVATTREEIAFTGGGARPSATGLQAEVAIVVDVTHATDYPGAEKRKHGDYRLGGGPVLTRGASINPVVFDLLVAAAESEGIAYGIEAAPRETSTDADAIFTAHRGVATALVSVPNRYMHSPNEMVALEDVDRAACLLAAFARRLAPGTDLVPR
ncbi:MAG: M42 family metallopeptidase [Gemmatimonadales bacterium]